MSIATEITRLQTAKADLKTSIEGKGVTVPSATKIDGYADLVDSIQTGGGGAFKVAEGTFVGDGTTYYDVELSGVEFSPDIVLITRADLRNMSAVNMRALAYFTGWKGRYFSGGQSSSGATNINSRNSIALAEGSFDGGGGRITYNDSTQKLKITCAIFGMGIYYAPVTYKYVLIKYTE